jgi:hypothetical protein
MTRGPKPIPVPPAVLAGAAATLAAVPGATLAGVAKAVGVGLDRLSRELKKDPDVSTERIRTNPDRSAEVTARAHEAVSRAQTELAGPDLPTVAEASERVAGALAVDVTSRVLARHRKEWDVPRGLLAEAVKARASKGTQEAFDMAKLAKISAETLTLVQMGECRAHGIKSGDVGPVIEVERDE